MSDEKVVEVPPLEPVKFIRILCSSCDHPMLAMSDAAFQAAREDHLTAVHRPRPSQASLMDDVPPAEAFEYDVPHDCFMCREECDCGSQKKCQGCRRCVVDGPPPDADDENDENDL